MTIDAATLTGLMVNGATVNYANLSSLDVDGGTGGNSFTVNGTPDNITTTLRSGTGDDTTDVTATGVASTLNIAGQGGADLVVLGSAGSAQGLNGTINQTNAAGSATDLIVDDSDDTARQSITIMTGTMTGSMVNNAIINYNRLNSLTVSGGSGDNTFLVTNTRANITTTLNTGDGADMTTIEATRNATLDINGDADDDTVLLSDFGIAQNFNGTINVANAGGTTALTVDDSADSIGQSLTMDDTQLSGSLVNTAFVNYSDLSGLTILGGSGGNTFTVNSTPPPDATTTIDKGSGPFNSVDVFGTMGPLDLTGTGGPDAVIIHQSASIMGPINIDEAPGSTSLVIDLSNDGLPHNFDLSSDGTTSTLHDEDGNIPADITYITASLFSVEIDTDPTQDEALNIDFSGGGNPIPTAGQPGLIFNAGDPLFDASHVLTISGELPSGPFASEVHNANDQSVFPQVGQYGSIMFTDAEAINTSLDYTGLNPITDTAPAVNDAVARAEELGIAVTGSS